MLSKHIFINSYIKDFVKSNIKIISYPSGSIHGNQILNSQNLSYRIAKINSNIYCKMVCHYSFIILEMVKLITIINQTCPHFVVIVITARQPCFLSYK